ncbi:MAG: hypothetical protein FJ304_06605 [Planctomycetes bacterium]|nr:hypothetical protein [Planctomycetota bacterium]
MRSMIVLAVLLTALAGCKKPKPTSASRDESANAKPQQPAAPTPAPGANPKNTKKDEPNWLTDPRFKKEQPKFDPGKPVDPAPTTAPGTGTGGVGKQPIGITPPQGGWTGPVPGVELPGPGGPNPNPGAVPPVPDPGAPPMPGVGSLPPPGPGMGVLQPQPNPNPNPPPLPGGNTPVGAARKAVALADMRDLQIFIHDASLASGKMPTPGDIYNALVAARSPCAEHVKAGSIILTGAKERESVWAYETAALTGVGLVVSQNGVEKLTAAELKQRLK